MSARLPSQLEIRELVCSVRLGWTLGERTLPQTVEVDFQIRFAERPLATETDQLEDTACYGELCTKVQALCARDEYRLIEHLTAKIFAELKKEIPATAQLRVSVRKPNPPVPNLKGGARFSLSDWTL